MAVGSLLQPLIDFRFIGKDPRPGGLTIDPADGQAELFFPSDAGPDFLVQVAGNLLPRIEDIILGHGTPAPSPNITVILNKLGKMSIKFCENSRANLRMSFNFNSFHIIQLLFFALDSIFKED
jgi:hypothetical protein